MKLSEILRGADLLKYASIENEKEFDAFARITTNIDGKKCVFIKNRKYAEEIDADTVSMVITGSEIARILRERGFGLCITADPRGLYFECMAYYDRMLERRIPSSYGNNCIIAKTARISSENVSIGDNVRIGDYVVIEEGVSIGSDTIIQSGCVIGAQGFTIYSFQDKMKQAYHAGQVSIGNNVLICCDSVIGRALYHYGVTRIGDRCQIGQRVGIGHNTAIGDDVSIYSGSSLAGYVTVGDRANIYMGVTVANGRTIGVGSNVNMGGVVAKDIPDGETWFGNPARKVIG